MPTKEVKGKKGKKGAAPVVKNVPKKPKVEEEDDDDSDSDDSEDEPVTKVVQKNAKKNKAAAPPPEESSDDDDDDDDEDDDDEDMGKKVAPAEDSDDDDDDDDDDEEESDEDEVPQEKGKKTPQAKMEVDEDEDSDEDEDDDDDEEESEDDSDEEETTETNGKRKKDKQKNKDAKKQKTEEAVVVFVGNLPKEMDEEKLKKMFVKKGVEVKGVRKPLKKRFGYVDLANPEDLDKALTLNGKKIGDDELKVEKAKSKLEPSTPTSNKSDDKRQSFGGKDDATLFVKNLAEETTEESLKEFFPDSVEIRMPRKPDDSHKGFAYVVFKEASSVETALSEKQGSELDGNALYLDKAGQKKTFQSPGGGRGGAHGGEAGKSKTLFVKNLSFDTDENSLKNAFSGCKEARIAKFPDTQKPKGFGFVEFESPEAAKEAFNSMKGTEVDGRQIFIDFAGDRGSGGGGGRGGFRGGRGGGRGGGFRGGRGGRGGFGGGRGGGDRGRGRGGFRGNRGGTPSYQGKKKTFDD